MLENTIPPEQTESENRLWKSPNLTTAEECWFPPTELKPHGYDGINSINIPVKFTPAHIPPEVNSYEDFKNLVHFTMRSRYAQVGLELVSLKLPLNPENGMPYFNRETFNQVKSGQELVVPLEFTNHSARAIKVEAGSGLFSLFHLGNSEFLRGNDLVQEVESSQIQISGDWTWFKKDGEIAGINVPISQDFKWIKPGPEPVMIGNEEKNYRQKIDEYLEPAPQMAGNVFWISETPHVKLAQNINAVIAQHLDMGIEDRPDYPLVPGHHIDSLLIDGGSDWPIRVEVNSPTIPEMAPKTVIFEFMK